VAIFERYYSTDNTNDDDIGSGRDVSESEDDILQIQEMDAGVSEDQEIDVNKEFMPLWITVTSLMKQM
jgi:hypothetical protein